MILFNLKDMLDILDLRSMGYYKIKPGILQQNLSNYYRFESADTICEPFNSFINTLKKERKKERKKEKQEQYPLLDSSGDRKYISDKDILDK